MPTAESMPDNIRRIAVLVASVDSATARQLLLHLPTSVAKQVRRALQSLGPISPAERQRILTEFQSTIVKQNRAAPQSSSMASVTQPTEAPSVAHNSSSSLYPSSIGASDRFAHTQAHSPSLAEHSEGGGSQLHSTSPQTSIQPSWKRMDVRALGHFLRTERASVIAVVIDQLPPDTGVTLLQQLPSTTHREVLQAIANLQDIDKDAMLSIEEHLAERIKDYEQHVSSEAKGTRRVAALLAAAPPELQEKWTRFVHIAIDDSNDSTSVPPSTAISPSVSDGDASRTEPKLSTQTTSQPLKSVESPISARSMTTIDAKLAVSDSHFDDSTSDDDPHILPFQAPGNLQPLSNADRSLIQLEFEQILFLSTQHLAQVLTAADSKTVLLALAGASPGFMKRFYLMLTKADGKALASRLSKIGPLKLRDIDEAQRSIAELSAKFLSARSRDARPAPPLRVAA